MCVCDLYVWIMRFVTFIFQKEAICLGFLLISVVHLLRVHIWMSLNAILLCVIKNFRDFFISIVTVFQWILPEAFPYNSWEFLFLPYFKLFIDGYVLKERCVL